MWLVLLWHGCGMPGATTLSAMNKRLIAGVLWLFAGWYLGNLLAFALGLSDFFGPILGVTAALLVAGDPFGLLWARAAARQASAGDRLESTAAD